MTVAKLPPVYEAWAAVMGDVQAVGKDSTNTQQNYKFRGVDAVMNAVGPVLRKHDVSVVPVAAGIVSEHQYTTKGGTAMRGVTVNVTFRVNGPAGDCFDGQALGEASDSGDKATSKAHSVAYRTFLLQALCLPTDDPDPDSESHERAAKPKPEAEPKQATAFPQPGPRGSKPDAETQKLRDELLALAPNHDAYVSTQTWIEQNAKARDAAGHKQSLKKAIAAVKDKAK